MTHEGPNQADGSRFLYVAVLGAAALGVVVGLAAPTFAQSLKPVGTAFVELVKMMISPIIFTTLVLGVGSVRKATTVGRVGLLALLYFFAMSTVALVIGLIVGNTLHPGAGVNLAAMAPDLAHATTAAPKSTTEFLLGLIPETLLSALTSGQVMQTLLVALLVGFAVQSLGARGEPILRALASIQQLIFKVLSMVMWVAPLGAFGAMAAVVGATGAGALESLAMIMIGFYATCLVFVVVVLGALLRMATGLSIFELLRYLGREFLLILSTSSSETALPRLIAKMEHLGISKPVVGIVVPTGYSFNLDGTAIYLTMASLFIGEAMQKPFAFGEQLALLAFMMVASKGAAGVTGAGIATLAGGLQSHRPDLVGGVGFIVGIDRFMSEARALTNFAGNAVATVLIGAWTKQLDAGRAREVLAGKLPFEERSESAIAPASDGVAGVSS